MRRGYCPVWGADPLNLALGLGSQWRQHSRNIAESIEMAEDRELFASFLNDLGIPQPPNGLATNEAEALEAAKKLVASSRSSLFRSRWKSHANRLLGCGTFHI